MSDFEAVRVDGIVGAAGRRSGLWVRASLDALGAAGPHAVHGTVDGASVGAAPPGRQAIAGSSAGSVVLAVHGSPYRRDGIAGAALTRILAERVAQWLPAGAERALDAAADELDGRFAVLLATTAASGRLIALRRGRSLALGEGEDVAIVASSVAALPPGLARVSHLERHGLTVLGRPSLVGGFRS